MTTSKPERIGPYPENIPDELKRLPRWVMWQWVWDEKKRRWDKPPLQVNGRNASSTDPATWTTFDAALAACGNGGRFDGIGIALGDDYAGVDFDHCIAPSTVPSRCWKR
jgi:putative DNA primase/helicase